MEEAKENSQFTLSEEHDTEKRTEELLQIEGK